MIMRDIIKSWKVLSTVKKAEIEDESFIDYEGINQHRLSCCQRLTGPGFHQ